MKPNSKRNEKIVCIRKQKKRKVKNLCKNLRKMTKRNLKKNKINERKISFRFFIKHFSKLSRFSKDFGDFKKIFQSKFFREFERIFCNLKNFALKSEM